MSDLTGRRAAGQEVTQNMLVVPDQTAAGGPDRRAEEEAGVSSGEGGEGRRH